MQARRDVIQVTGCDDLGSTPAQLQLAFPHLEAQLRTLPEVASGTFLVSWDSVLGLPWCKTPGALTAGDVVSTTISFLRLNVLMLTRVDLQIPETGVVDNPN